MAAAVWRLDRFDEEWDEWVRRQRPNDHQKASVLRWAFDVVERGPPVDAVDAPIAGQQQDYVPGAVPEVVVTFDTDESAKVVTMTDISTLVPFA